MSKGRLEAFSDGVIAIIITIMVLELKVPHGADLAVLKPLVPVFFSYVLSFIYLAIYWNNHHHLLKASNRINGKVLWANVHLLFWLSLIPFVTGWMGENNFASMPAALYGIVLLGAAFAYFVLTQTLIRIHDTESTLRRAIQKDTKEKLSLLLYASAVVIAPFASWLSCVIYAVVALIWLVPDLRIERTIDSASELAD